MSEPKPTDCDDVEITPEMIEAGVQVFASFYPDSHDGGETDYRMVRRILEAVSQASGGGFPWPLFERPSRGGELNSR